MEKGKRKLEELDVMSNFMTNKLSTDERVKDSFCRLMLKALLGRDVGKISIRGENMLPGHTQSLRGIRMDVEIEEFAGDYGNVPYEGETDNSIAGDTARRGIKSIYDLEPHNRNNTFLPKRNRFYQAKKDGMRMAAGVNDFRLLPELFIISIAPYDPFGYDHMVYTIRNRCDEIPELEYGDELNFVYFYTKGKKGGTEELGRFLRYLEDSREENAVDENTRRMHELVKFMKIQPEVEVEFMTWGEFIDGERMDQAEETRKEVTKEVTEKVTKEVNISSITSILEEYGGIPEDVTNALWAIDDVSEFTRLIKLAAKVDNVDDFAQGLPSHN